MQRETLNLYLDQPAEAESWLRSLGLNDCERGHKNLLNLARCGMTLDVLQTLLEQLAQQLPALSDPDRAFNNIERFFLAARNPLGLGALFERDPHALPPLLQIFSTSQHLSDLLIRDPASFDLLQMTEGQPVSRSILIEELCSEAAAARDSRDVMMMLRRCKHRETLRIAYGDIVRQHHIETVTRQISYLADAICEAAIQAARRELEQQRGTPLRPDGQRARFTALALGKLGGVELNYSSDIDLIFLCDDDGQTDADRPITNLEFFERLSRRVVKLLNDTTELGAAYRVDLRLRPQGSQGPAVIGLRSALRYYDVSGRTWERQAFVKARPIAGDLDLGQEFLKSLEPWIYQHCLTWADISSIKALKRRIEHRTLQEGEDQSNVKTGVGGIRDIEFVIQFLQLLNGGHAPELRTVNTLEAIASLERAGCLTMQERTLLERNYSFLRKIEHRLQILFDMQTHTLPEDPQALRQVAIRMGFADGGSPSALEKFQEAFQVARELNRKILDHILHSAFGREDQVEPEVDLILDPDPPEETIDQVLRDHHFQQPREAYRNLMDLSRENVAFLSTQRCRHFLASIAPPLLDQIAAAPNPDSTLSNLCLVSDSLGGKGVLWELFSFNRPSMELYVRLCASAPYLASLLTSHPGMIDELMDSLMMKKPPTLDWLAENLQDLTRGAEDLDPILHSFKNSQHLRVGVLDILGKADIFDTHRALSDIAEACFRQTAAYELERLAEKHGQPMTSEGKPCELIVLAMGKLGGREPNYHSDLDVIFLYEEEGFTQSENRKAKTTTNQHFFGMLGQRLTKRFNQLGPLGRLYELDARLRPTGRSGMLAVSLQELQKYFDPQTGAGQLWERQALCKARPIYGSPEIAQTVMELVRNVIVGTGWRAEHAAQIHKMRMRMEDTAAKANLKRGPGGTVDVEFAVQMLQLKHAEAHPEVLTPGTLQALERLAEAGCMDIEQSRRWQAAYRFLRGIEARLRLMNTTARHDFPTEDAELKKLAFLLRSEESPEQLREECERYMRENRERFEALFAQQT